ncbi:DUF1802 family protein [Cyanobacteria bacterium FACHB-471]|nr:DUF1802 family protein [Cyanobacteria bacterium FACHB-471]
MVEPVLIDKVLYLPAPDAEGLAKGWVVAAVPKVSIQEGWSFLVCPSDTSINPLPIERQYHPNFLSTAKSALIQLKDSTVKVNFWAKCEFCTLLYEVEQLNVLSQLTNWTPIALKTALEQRQHLFLTCLRIYHLPEPIEVSTDSLNPTKTGKFVSLSSLGLPEHISIPMKVNTSLPVISDVVFNQRKLQLAERKLPLYPQLEKLHDLVAQMATTDSKAKQLEQDIKVFLGWSTYERTSQADPDTSWIKLIAAVGNSSDGDLFEKLVRRSFMKLGFKNSNLNPQASLDPNSCGGAGGLDFYCEEPYPVVGECKATKTDVVPDSTPAQLVKLGLKHLQKQYENCIKVIMAAGALNSHAQKTAIGNKMNVIRPETLQRLVELKAKYDGSVNLLDLKSYLEADPFGEDADVKLNDFVNQVLRDIRVRSHIIKAIEQLTETEPDRKQFEVVEIRTQYNASFARLDGGVLDNQTVHEILIELSSPLTGYLGRLKTTSLQSDRFYFLRHMPEIVEQ